MGKTIMIVIFNHKTRHFTKAFYSHFKLRYQLLVNKQYWDLNHFKGMEYDQFDTPAASYILWVDENQEARACLRVAPTDRPYMIKDVFPSLVEDPSNLPNSLSVWEASRLCVDLSLSKTERAKILKEIVLACLEFGLENDIEHFLGVMPKKLWDHVFINNGWDINFMGKQEILEDGGDVIAGKMDVSLAVLKSIRDTTKIKYQDKPKLLEEIRHIPQVKAA